MISSVIFGHVLEKNISNVSLRDISTTIINTSTVKLLAMSNNGLTVLEAVAISDMTICLEEFYISDNQLGDYGAELLSEGISKYQNSESIRHQK